MDEHQTPGCFFDPSSSSVQYLQFKTTEAYCFYAIEIKTRLDHVKLSKLLQDHLAHCYTQLAVNMVLLAFMKPSMRHQLVSEE